MRVLLVIERQKSAQKVLFKDTVHEKKPVVYQVANHFDAF